jgi:hypothetical protein
MHNNFVPTAAKGRNVLEFPVDQTGRERLRVAQTLQQLAQQGDSNVVVLAQRRRPGNVVVLAERRRPSNVISLAHYRSDNN